MQINVKVPCKCILFGEHLALIGKPTLAIPLSGAPFELNMESKQSSKLDIQFEQDSPEFPAAMLKNDIQLLNKLRPIKNQALKINIQSNLPPGAGAGISAAWSVAIVKALYPNLDEKTSLEMLQVLEDSHHGKASGIDHLTIWQSAPVLLENGKAKVLSKKILSPKIREHFRIWVSGVPKESTAEMVKISQKNMSDLSNEIDALMDKKALIENLQKERINELIEGINQYGKVLEKLGVVSQKTKAKLDMLRTQGFGAKVSGAGGLTDGSGLCLLVHSDPLVWQNLTIPVIPI